MKASVWIERIGNGLLDARFTALYGKDNRENQVERYTKLLGKMAAAYPDDDVSLYSAPGRTEISGNHTDHNHGKVIAAGIHLDCIAVAAPCAEPQVTLVSDGYHVPFVVELSDTEPLASEVGTTASLIRGIAARMQQQNHITGGMRCFVTSDVLPGSGLSSSAAIEVLIATIFNHLYNKGQISPLDLACICQYAENHYFGKPCGLMDQAASAFGGIAAMDFREPQHALVGKIDYSFEPHGYSLTVVDSGSSHADLTYAYAEIPVEMKSVARQMGKTVCREVDYNAFLQKLPLIRENTGDRALLRYLHFHAENMRVDKQIACLKTGDLSAYLALVKQSGSSSWRLLQNCYAPGDPHNQGVSLALALTENFLDGDGACRVHGGGFAGTIQAYVPNQQLTAYIRYIETVFGTGAVIPIKIRSEGAVVL